MTTATMPDKCPRCGAEAADSVALANPGVEPREWACGTFRVLSTDEVVDTEDCLRRQNAALREALRNVESDARIAYDELRDGQYDNAESYIWRVIETLEKYAPEVSDDA